jgi:CheY-like chemotaxis protein
MMHPGGGSRVDSYRVRVPRVLIVDDSPSIRLLIRANLELAGFEVDEVEDGVACVEWLQACVELPDVVTLDVMMPKQGGIATAMAIRSDPRTAGVPIVMVTTQNLPADIARGERAGVDAYVTKPFDPDELVATVSAVATVQRTGPSDRAI